MQAAHGMCALVNASFNVAAEPIVCTPEDAFCCFMGTQIDMLVCADSLLHKRSQDPKLLESYARNTSQSD